MPDSAVAHPSETALFGEKEEGHGDFLMDLRTGNEVTVLEQRRHGGTGLAGSANYAFADGSARLLLYGKSLRPVNLWAITSEWRNNTW